MYKLKEKFPDRIYMLDFDKLCFNKENSLEELFDFFSIDVKNITSISKLIKPPSSIGRYKSENISVFCDDDIQYIKNIYENLELN
jgi:hypothetical protein